MSRSLTNILFYGNSSVLSLIEAEAEKTASTLSGVFTEEDRGRNIQKEKMDIHLMEKIEEDARGDFCHLLISGYSLNRGPEQWVRKIALEHGVTVKYTDLSQAKNFFISMEGNTTLKKIITPYISERSILEYGAEPFYESVIRKVKGRVIYHRREISRIAKLFINHRYATKEDILRDWEIPNWSLIDSLKTSCGIHSDSSIPAKAVCKV